MKPFQARIDEFVAIVIDWAEDIPVRPVRDPTKTLEKLEILTTHGQDFLVANVRGCGACGYRAFITNLVLKNTGKLLPYDPAGIHDHIAALKTIMLDFIDILADVSDEDNTKKNQWFINGLLDIPDNKIQLGDSPTLLEYRRLVITQSYYASNYDFQLLAMLFKVQINIIISKLPNRINPELLDSFSHYSYTGVGMRIAAPCKDHYNIVQVPMHYQVVLSIPNNMREISFQEPYPSM